MVLPEFEVDETQGDEVAVSKRAEDTSASFTMVPLVELRSVMSPLPSYESSAWWRDTLGSCRTMPCGVRSRPHVVVGAMPV